MVKRQEGPTRIALTDESSNVDEKLTVIGEPNTNACSYEKSKDQIVNDSKIPESVEVTSCSDEPLKLLNGNDVLVNGDLAGGDNRVEGSDH